LKSKEHFVDERTDGRTDGQTDRDLGDSEESTWESSIWLN